MGTGNEALGPIHQWLYLLAGLAFCLVVNGEIIHVLHAGPPIGTFRTINALLPPMSEAGWRALFSKFTSIPAFEINQDPAMALAVFKISYMWEWVSVSLTRAIYLVATVGGILLWTRGLLNWRLTLSIGGLFLILTLYAVLELWIGTKGFNTRLDLVQIPDAIRLGMEALIFAWTVLVVSWMKTPGPTGRVRLAWPVAVIGIMLLVFVELIFGGIAEGLNAGRAYNTWPLIEGAIIPRDLWFFSPWWRNLVSNALTVQFLHRMLGYLILVSTLAVGIVGRRSSNRSQIRLRFFALMICVVVESGLGIGLLLVPSASWLALCHVVFLLFLVGVLADFSGVLIATRWHLN